MKNTFAAVAFAALVLSCSASAETLNKSIPAPAVAAAETNGPQVAVLAGGCFWGLQGMFQHVDGVTQVDAGYSGGDKATAHYEMVGTETTGHAESVKITFDPKRITYGQLLRIYFSVAHDPTQLNRQDPDSGPSYRSEIFFTTPMQERVARAYVKQLNDAKVFASPIVTKIEPMKGFYAAEEYHQNYLIRHPDNPYIARFDMPKVAALKKVYPQCYRATPVTVGSTR
jgi:peptide-methionine (S)-S-oxide reductase